MPPPNTPTPPSSQTSTWTNPLYHRNGSPPLFANLDFLTNYRYDRDSIPAYRSAWFRPAVRRMKLKRPLKFLLFEDIYQKPYFLMGFVLISELLFTPTPITPLIGVEPVQLWGQRDCPSPKATLNGQSLLQFAPLSNKNFTKTGVGVNCNRKVRNRLPFRFTSVNYR